MDKDVRAEKGPADLPVELQILEMFASSSLAVVGPSDVERMLHISKGTASRALKTLAAHGYLAAMETGRYSLGDKMFALTMRYMGCVMTQIDVQQEMFNRTLGSLRSTIGQVMSCLPIATKGGVA